MDWAGIDDSLVEAFGRISTNNTPQYQHPLTGALIDELSSGQAIQQQESLPVQYDPDTLNHLLSSINGGTVPDFSVSHVRVPRSAGSYLTFHLSDVDANCDDVYLHGWFDHASGTYTASTPGLFLFLFNGLGGPVGQASVQLLVNGQARSTCIAEPINHQGYFGSYGTLSMSVPLAMERGDRVGVFLSHGWIHEEEPFCVTRFSGIFL